MESVAIVDDLNTESYELKEMAEKKFENEILDEKVSLQEVDEETAVETVDEHVPEKDEDEHKDEHEEEHKDEHKDEHEVDEIVVVETVAESPFEEPVVQDEEIAKETENLIEEEENSELVEKDVEHINQDEQLVQAMESLPLDSVESTQGIDSAKEEEAVFTPPVDRDDGPVRQINDIKESVRRTNPIHQEILFTISLLQLNDPSLTSIEIKDYLLSHTLLEGIIAGIASSTHISVLILKNVGIQTGQGVKLAQEIAKNSSLKRVCLDGNALGPQALYEFAKMLHTNTSVQELRLANQNSITPIGQEAEHSFADAFPKNESLVKLAVDFRSNICRDKVNRGITRNMEIARKLRLAANSQ